MLASDKPYISSIIVILYAATCIHCFVRTAAISRESDRAHRVLSLVSHGGPNLRVVGQDVVAPDGAKLPPGHITTHIRNIILKAGLQGGRIDQTLLLRGLADALRGPNQLGSFASDSLMKLGFLGTIVGFILMLAPIARLDAADHASMKLSMALMSDGLAAALDTTAACL